MNWLKPDWPLPKGVHAAVTLRTGGVSGGSYASLNPAGHVLDDPKHVAENRLIIKTMLQLPAEPIWLQQVHGVTVVRADQAEPLTQADASYTEHSGIVCTVLTADCLPLLFCGDHGRVIAAAHAGWRGLQAGVIAQTIKHMHCRDVQVWLGPAIGPANFIVGTEVFNAFVGNNSANKSAFRSSGPEKWLTDIYQLARLNLAELGIDQIYGGGLCTVADPLRFYSYRRDGAASGRMASMIWRD